MNTTLTCKDSGCNATALLSLSQEGCKMLTYRDTQEGDLQNCRLSIKADLSVAAQLFKGEAH